MTTKYNPLLTELKHLENFVFIPAKINDKLNKYRFISDNGEFIDIYFNTLLFGFCAKKDIKILEFEGDYKNEDFLLKNESLNYLDKLISFLERKNSLNKEKIANKLYRNE
jgi:hypothetical protein